MGSDHDLVLMPLKLKLQTKRKPQSTRIRFDLEKLQDPLIAEEFQAQIGGKFAALNIIDSDTNTIANEFSKIMTTTAEEVLGKHRKKKQPWVTNEILDLCDRRRELKPQKSKSPQKAEEYRKANNRVKQGMKAAKEAWIESECKIIDSEMRRARSKKAYQTLKTLTKQSQDRTSVIENKEGELLTENTAILERWTEYCTDLYNHNIQPDQNLLHNPQADDDEYHLPILRSEVRDTIRKLKEGKSHGVDNVPGELIKRGGEATEKVLTTLCQKVWETKEWPSSWTQSLVIPLPKKGNLKQCQNYRTISLISHPSKILLGVILNRLKPITEEFLSEEQAGFRKGRSTVQQILNCRILAEKHIEHQRSLFHNFIDFKKAFDRVWHTGLWDTMRQFKITEDIVQAIETLYQNATSSVLLNNVVGEEFRTTVGVRQGCLLSPVVFNIFLERIMQEALHDHHTSISIGGHKVCNLRFADDIDLMAGSNEELQQLTDRLATSAASFGMEISIEKSKVMSSGSEDTVVDIKMSGSQLERVDRFKYLGAYLTRDGTSTNEIKVRTGTATSAMTRLTRMWKSDNINFRIKHRLYQSLVVSILLYGCEAWTLTAQLEKKISTFESKQHRKLLGISYRERKTNEYVREKIEDLVGKQEPLLATVKRRKLAFFGHMMRHDSLSKIIIQGTVEGQRKRGRPKKSWLTNIIEWTGMGLTDLLTATQHRDEWRTITRTAALRSPLRPSRSRD